LLYAFFCGSYSSSLGPHADAELVFGSPRRSRLLPDPLKLHMRVPILKQGEVVIASVQSALSDGDLLQLRDDLAAHIEQRRPKGVIVDVTVLEVIDSFATRTVRELAQTARLRGAITVIVGIQPEVAFGMVQLGLDLGNVATALDLEEGLALLDHHTQ